MSADRHGTSPRGTRGANVAAGESENYYAAACVAKLARQREEHAGLVGAGHGLDVQRVARRERVENFLDQHLGRRRAGGDAERLDALELRPVDLGRALHQHRIAAAGALGDLLKPPRIRRIRRADHDQRIDLRRHALDRLLAVGGGVADVLLVRSDDVREAALERGDDVGGVVERQRRLRHIGELARVPRLERLGLLDRLHQRDGAVRQLAERADDLGMPGVADQHDLAAALVMDFGLAVDLGDQRAGGVEREEVAALRLHRNRFRHAMGGEDHRRLGVRNLGEFLDEDRALGLEALDHVAVVHDLVADVDRRAIALERLLDRIDGPHHAGAEPARRAEQHLELRLLRNCRRFRVIFSSAMAEK